MIDKMKSMALPEGEYPLQIGSVTLTAEVSEQPWTRVSESPADGMSSVWADGDRIGVRIGDNEETGIYVMNVDAEGRVVGVIPEKPVYWKDKQPATITAWYPLNEELDFTHQDNGLTYLLKATGNGNYQSTPINLNFTHQLAKVRVKLEGTKANEVTAVTVRSYPTSTHSHGTLDSQDRSLTPQYVPMRRATYGSVEYWEANLRPGYLDANNSFQVANADGVRVQVTQGRVDIEAGHVHTIKINVGEAQQVTGEISDNGTYIVSGTRTEPVTITGGKPTIYLENASISVSSGPAINVTRGTPTIHVTGENAIETSTSLSSCSAGIYVAEGSSVTIEGSGTDDVLRVTGGADGAAIGGYSDNGDKPCGNIAIKNVTLHAYAIDNYATAYAPGIGATGGTCGRIEISSAIVYARSFGEVICCAPAIGAYESVPEIVITDSEIHAYRGSDNGTSYADYIGQGGNSYGYHGGDIQCGTGSITNTTVYKGTYNWSSDTSSNEGSVYYDEEGNEIPQ